MSHADWMLASLNGSENLFQDLYLAGTHNSSSSSIGLLSSAVPGTASVLKIVKPLAIRWSRCQSTGIYEQLMDGIRIFDLRTCRMENGKIYTCHGFCNAPLEQVLCNEFLRFHRQHPNEIITVFSKLDWDYEQSLGSPENKSKESELHLRFIKQCLHGKLYEGYNTYNVREIWQSGKPFILSPHKARVVWLEADTEQDLYQRACAVLSAHEMRKPEECTLLVLQLMLTPTLKDIVKSLLTPCIFSSSLPKFEHQVLQHLHTWIEQWRVKHSFKFSVMVDFYSKTRVVETCLNFIL